MRALQWSIVTILLASPAGAQPQGRLALADAVAEAVARNPGIGAAERRYDAARQRPIQERSLPDPMISAGYVGSGRPWPGAGLGVEPTANIGVMISQDLPYPGTRNLRASLASRDADAEFQQIDIARSP
jgi:outer membrane protein, heavy metal efflux system